MTEKTRIPLPTPTRLSAPHWEGCRTGELRVQRCRDCGEHIFIPQPACTHCLSMDLQWVLCSGRGRLYSYTVVHRPQQPAFDIPYVVAIVELEEGLHMLTNLIDCPERSIRVDMPVEAVFQPVSDEITLPYFRPAVPPRENL